MSVLFNENAKTPLIEGVNLIGRAVSTTFGPNGKNVIIKNRGGIHITKDGATVARYVNHENPIIEMGIEVVRQIATKTAKDVGDGTSTSVILAQAIINELKDNNDHPIQIQRDLEEDTRKVIDYLESIKKEIISYDDLVKVATLSANNDESLGKLIAEAYQKVGKEGVVNFEESNDITDSIVYTTGMQLDSGYSSPYFINSDNNTSELENVYIAIINEKLTELKQILPHAEYALKLGKELDRKMSMLVIAPKIESQIIKFLIMNNDQLQSCAIVTPNHGIYRDIILDDIKSIVGDTLICDKVEVSKDNTILIGGNSIKEEVDKKIEDIRKKLNSKSLSEFEIIFHKKRLANLNGGIATILIGGYSKVEIIEKKDRIEDAVSAVRAALDNGILPGGGVSLYRASLNVNTKYLSKIIREPFKLLMENSNATNVVNTILSNNDWQGINFKTLENGDMYEMGIIDPFLVTKIALTNAVSAASLILTNGCSILNME